MAVPFDLQTYQKDLHDIFPSVIEVYNDAYTGVPNESYVVHTVPEGIRQFLHNKFIFQTPVDFDFTWLQSSRDYVAQLPNSKKNVIRAYTRHGDEVINEYLRNPLAFPSHKTSGLLFETMPDQNTYLYAVQVLRRYSPERSVDSYFTDQGVLTEEGKDRIKDIMETTVRRDIHTIKDMIKEYISELREIIQSAPRPTEDIYVFRGVDSDYMDVVDTPIHQRGFNSTTFSPNIAVYLSAESKHVYQIIIREGTPCICTRDVSEFPNEWEILLDTDVYGIAGEKRIVHPLFVENYVGAFPPDHLWNPQTPEYTARFVVFAGEEVQQGGGYHTNKPVPRTIQNYLRTRLRSLVPKKRRNRTQRRRNRYSSTMKHRR
jgi:hypothetical protein